MVSLNTFPVWLRVANAIEAYVAYLGKTLWPANLAVLYPYNLHPHLPAGHRGNA